LAAGPGRPGGVWQAGRQVYVRLPRRSWEQVRVPALWARPAGERRMPVTSAPVCQQVALRLEMAWRWLLPWPTPPEPLAASVSGGACAWVWARFLPQWAVVCRSSASTLLARTQSGYHFFAPRQYPSLHHGLLGMTGETTGKLPLGTLWPRPPGPGRTASCGRMLNAAGSDAPVVTRCNQRYLPQKLAQSCDRGVAGKDKPAGTHAPQGGCRWRPPGPTIRATASIRGLADAGGGGD
jgi:hypothetical protein